ncbi:MAG: class I SAM-dependent methyltransferase [Eubacteriales bacterium]
MEAYTDFASVYDTFMDETPYKQWCEHMVGFFNAYDIKDGLLLDLGCGTGTMTEYMSNAGYDLIGVDNSIEMLNVAMKKKEQSKLDILYLHQDMRAFELYGTVKGIYSVCDSMNYIMNSEELIEVFRLVNMYLEPNGIFVFDFNTIYKYKTIIGDATIAENRENCSFIWENYYEEDSKINEYDLTLFVEEKEGLFRRFQETHYQRAYELEEMKAWIKQSGLLFLEAYDAEGLGVPTETSERIYMIVKECGKGI